MKKLKRITSIMSAIVLIALFAFVVCMQIYPNETSRVIGFRFYTVLTDSMEPVIPTYSLVFSKMVDEDDEIKPNDIVTFKANRFGEDILLTHYFRKTQYGDDGNLYYRTQGATADDYDNYETSRSDIIGTYVFHIPYLGKVFLFMQSKFGFLLYAELLVILLINKTILARIEEKEKNSKKPIVVIEEVKQIEDNKVEDINEEVIETPVPYHLSAYEINENLTAVYGQTLSEIVLNDNHLSWVDSSQRVMTGLHTYKAFYTPRHASNIGIASEVDIEIDTEKAVPKFTLPNRIFAEYGSYLYQISLPRHFVWEDDQMSVKVGAHKYNAIYVPEDNENYSCVKVSIKVEVPMNIKIDPQFYLQGWDTNMRVQCSLPIHDISKINIDDITLDDDDLVKEDTSFVISIRCFKELSAGKHKLRLYFDDYLLETTFTII